MTSTSDPFSADPGPSGVGPYFGKRYQAHPGYVDRQNWLAGGGTAYDYDWRSGTPYSPPGASDPGGEPASQSYTSYSGETKRYV